MTHLTQAEMTRWLDDGRADERARVLSHLASCDACRGALAEMVGARIPAVEAARFDARDFVARGHEAYRATPSSAGRWNWRYAASAIAIAAALVLAAFVIPQLRRTPQDPGGIPTETRGGDLRPIEPSGVARLPFEFRWSSPVAASKYRVSVVDAAGRVIYSESSLNEHLPVTADLRARLVPGGEYLWTVEALDAADAKIAGSSPQRFTVAR